jgi:tellurite methyltransferase
MPVEDAERWDRRYLQDSRFRTYTRPRDFLVEQAGRLPDRGWALDVAMGLGGNASYLLARGLKVVGLDISGVAARRAKEWLPELMAVQVDLINFDLPSGKFDVILNFYYLQRSLWDKYRDWLLPGGILVFESLTLDMLKYQPDIDPQYLLQPGELLDGFRDFEILEYREGERISGSGRRSAVASLIARYPAVPGAGPG